MPRRGSPQPSPQATALSTSPRGPAGWDCFPRVPRGRGRGCGPGWRAVLTGDGQVGVGLDLPAGIAGEALEDAGVAGLQLLDAQAPVRERPVPRTLPRANGDGVLVPAQRGERGPCVAEGTTGVRDVNLQASRTRGTNATL